jgi:hypothetical protein
LLNSSAAPRRVNEALSNSSKTLARLTSTGSMAPGRKRTVKMIAEQSLRQILVAADQADAEDVAIRAALYIALRGIEEDVAAITGRDAPSTRTPCDARRPPPKFSRAASLGKLRSSGPRFH